MKLYLDSSAIIYSIEGASALREAVLARLTEAEAVPSGKILTSQLARLECRVHPLRDRRQDLLDTYDQLFARQSMTMLEITPLIIDRATELRARLNLKTPDAIHVATAIGVQADVLLTGDRDLRRCHEIHVEII